MTAASEPAIDQASLLPSVPVYRFGVFAVLEATAPFFCDLFCFGFLASRFDRFCPFAMASSLG